MKYLLVLFCCCSFISTAVAKCTSSGIYISNNTTELNKNGLVILEFYANSQLLIPGLNIQYPVYLRSSEGKVTLVVRQVLKGYRVTQVIFTADTNLDDQLTYEFHLDKLPKGERKPFRPFIDKQDGKHIVFTVSKASKQTMPSFTGEPTEQKKTFEVFGCGPAKWVYFTIDLSDTTVKFVKALVRSTIKGTTTAYILPVENGLVAIGHDMCGGAFDFNEPDFEVVFALLDSSGNEAVKTNPLAFKAPVLKTG